LFGISDELEKPERETRETARQALARITETGGVKAHLPNSTFRDERSPKLDVCSQSIDSLSLKSSRGRDGVSEVVKGEDDLYRVESEQGNRKVSFAISLASNPRKTGKTKHETHSSMTTQEPNQNTSQLSHRLDSRSPTQTTRATSAFPFSSFFLSVFLSLKTDRWTHHKHLLQHSHLNPTRQIPNQHKPTFLHRRSESTQLPNLE